MQTPGHATIFFRKFLNIILFIIIFIKLHDQQKIMISISTQKDHSLIDNIS